MAAAIKKMATAINQQCLLTLFPQKLVHQIINADAPTYTQARRGRSRCQASVLMSMSNVGLMGNKSVVVYAVRTRTNVV